MMKLKKWLRWFVKGLFFMAFVMVVNTIIKLLQSWETSISILKEDRVPLPSMTLCPYPTEPVNTTNMTLVSLLNSNHPINLYQLLGSGYVEINGSYHINDFINERILTNLDVFVPTRFVSVVNGTLTNCMRVEVRQQYLHSSLGLVSNVISKISYPVSNDILLRYRLL